MKIIILDEMEFADASESVAIAVCKINKWTGIKGFCLATEEYPLFYSNAFKSNTKVIVDALLHKAKLREDLFDNLNIKLAGDEPATVLKECWDELDYVIEYKHQFIRYYWLTSVA